MNPQEPDPSRLPKWAQRRLETLERDLADAQSRLAAGPDDSDTFADPYRDVPRPLGKGTMIQFGDVEEGAFNVSFEDGQLRIQFASLRSQGLVVLPWSSNSVRLEGARQNQRPR